MTAARLPFAQLAQTCCETSFNRHVYRRQPIRPLGRYGRIYWR